MCKMKRHNSALKALNPLLKITTAIAGTPPYTFGAQPKYCSKIFKAHAVFVMALILTGYFYNFYGKVYHGVLRNLGASLYFVDFVTSGLIALASLSIVSISVLWRSDKFKMLLFNIEQFDSLVGLNVENNEGRFKKIFIPYKIFVVFLVLFDAYTWIHTISFETYRYYIARNLMWYQVSMVIFLIFLLALEIERRFKEINNCLIRCAKGVNTAFLIPTRLNEFSINKKKNRPFNIKMCDITLLKSIKIWYNDFVKVVEEFNSVFGLVLLFDVLFNIANVVNYTHGILFVFVQTEVTFGTDAVIDTTMWTVAAFLQTLLIAAACERLSNEASRITIICYSLLSQVPSLPKTDYEVALREELLLIAEQTANCHPRVLAAGFFEVNLGMMGFVVASATSYVVVTIQFM